MVQRDTKVSLGYKKIESLVVPQSLDAPKIKRGRDERVCSLAVITAEGGAVRWRDDGVAPTPTDGMPLQAGSTLVYDGNLAKIQFIGQLPLAKLNVSFYE